MMKKSDVQKAILERIDSLSAEEIEQLRSASKKNSLRESLRRMDLDYQVECEGGSDE